MDDRSFAEGMPAALPPMRDLAAAAVCGVCWGLFYRFFPRHLPALALSHALWDALAFVVAPIG